MDLTISERYARKVKFGTKQYKDASNIHNMSRKEDILALLSESYKNGH